MTMFTNVHVEIPLCSIYMHLGHTVICALNAQGYSKCCLFVAEIRYPIEML